MIASPDKIARVKLMFWKKTEMPESKMIEGADGKKSFVKTGSKVEMTTYTFRDSFGDSIEILSKENGYRVFEGKFVDVDFDIKFDEFKKVVRVKLAAVRESQSQLV